MKTRFKKGHKSVSYWKGKKLSLETRMKMRESHKGKKCHTWKGGISSLIALIRSHFIYRQWRSDVFTRDNFICQECGDATGGNLEAHHLKPFAKLLQKYEITTLEQAIKCEALWNINNGITYCEECHKLTDNYAKIRR